jgi:hypothetical protein
MVNLTKGSFLFVLFMFLQLVVFSSCERNVKNESQRLEQLIGKEAWAVLQSPREVFLMDAREGWIGEEEAKRVKLSASQIKRVQQVLLNDSHYYFDLKKRTLFVPTVAFKFQGEIEIVVLISMSANQVKVLIPGKAIILDNDPIQQEVSQLLPEWLTLIQSN